MGKVEFAYGFKQMASPHFEKLEDGRAAGTILPVHYVSDGVSRVDAPHRKRRARGRRQSVRSDSRAAARKAEAHEQCPRVAFDPLSSSMAERDIARRRLAYEECLYLQLALRLRNDGGWSMWCPMPTPRASIWPRSSKPCRFR